MNAALFSQLFLPLNYQNNINMTEDLDTKLNESFEFKHWSELL